MGTFFETKPDGTVVARPRVRRGGFLDTVDEGERPSIEDLERLIEVHGQDAFDIKPSGEISVTHRYGSMIDTSPSRPGGPLDPVRGAKADHGPSAADCELCVCGEYLDECKHVDQSQKQSQRSVDSVRGAKAAGEAHNLASPGSIPGPATTPDERVRAIAAGRATPELARHLYAAAVGVDDALERRTGVGAFPNYRPQRQTTFGKPYGNCWGAAICTLLGTDLATFPDLSGCVTPDHIATWWERTTEFLSTHGYAIVSGYDAKDKRAPAGFALASGPGPRDVDHTVVVYDGRVVWDPHPSDDGLKRIEEYRMLWPVVERSGPGTGESDADTERVQVPEGS